MCVTSNEVFMMHSLLLLAHLERIFVATIATEGVVYILHHYIFTLSKLGTLKTYTF